MDKLLNLTIFGISAGNEQLLQRLLQSTITLPGARIVIGIQEPVPSSARTLVEDSGGRVVRFRWNDRFDDALNETLANIETEWVLRLDDDEWISENHVECLEKALSSSYDAFECLTIDCLRGNRRAYSYKLRLFRLNPNVKYVGAVHEILYPYGTPAYRGICQKLCFTVAHDGYLPDYMPAKAARNKKILDAELAKNKNDSHYRLKNISATLSSKNEMEDEIKYLESLLTSPDTCEDVHFLNAACITLEQCLSQKINLSPSFLFGLICRFGHNPRLNWDVALASNMIGLKDYANVRIEHQLGFISSEDIDFRVFFRPQILGNELFEIIQNGKKWRGTKLATLVRETLKLNVPDITPSLDPRIGMDTLWIPRKALRQLEHLSPGLSKCFNGVDQLLTIEFRNLSIPTFYKKLKNSEVTSLSVCLEECLKKIADPVYSSSLSCISGLRRCAHDLLTFISVGSLSLEVSSVGWFIRFGREPLGDCNVNVSSSSNTYGNNF